MVVLRTGEKVLRGCMGEICSEGNLYVAVASGHGARCGLPVCLFLLGVPDLLCA